MTQNYKNLLQEYCQRNRIDLPVYSSKECKESGWYSMVDVAGKLFKTPKSFQTKKAAEQYIAGIAYVSIQKPDNITVPTVDNFDFPDQLFNDKPDPPKVITDEPTNLRYIVLCDIENIQPTMSAVKPFVSMNFFQSTYSSVDKKKYTAYGTVHEVDLAGSDVADHLMTYVGSRLQYENPNAVFVIVSRDKSSGILAKLLRDDHSQVHHFKNAPDFEAFLSQL